MTDAAVPGPPAAHPPSPRQGRGAALRRAVAAPEALLTRARDSMTPGQRQTAALAVAVALAVVLVGLPRKTVAVPVAGPAAPHRAAAVAPKAAPAPAVAARPVPSQLVTGPALQPAPAEPSAVFSDSDLPTAPAVPTIVALVRSGDSPVPGRDDPDVAAAFLARSGFTATTLAYDPTDPAMCTKITAAGRIVVASRGIEQPIRDCLVSAGEVIVAADALGDLPPASAGAGQVVSTIRGITDSLTDLARWGKASGTLSGRVGLVTVKSAAPAVDAAKRAMESMGINVVDDVAVADDTTAAAADIANAVLDFSSKQVSTVVFAAPVADQRIWVNDATLLSPGTRYVVSDAFDGVTNEAYPPTFDGAVAHTSVRVPWFARSHGTTTAQAACEATWTQTATVPATAPGDETVRVYEWCTNVGLVSAVMRTVDAPDAGDPVAALRTQTLPSALTADLGPLPNGGFGPTQDAVLVWRATCACWQESTPFASRAA